MITEEEIRERAENHCKDTLGKKNIGNDDLWANRRSGFKYGALTAQKLMLERASEGFKEWLLNVSYEDMQLMKGITKATDEKSGPMLIWQGAKLSAEKQISMLKDQVANLEYLLEGSKKEILELEDKNTELENEVFNLELVIAGSRESVNNHKHMLDKSQNVAELLADEVNLLKRQLKQQKFNNSNNLSIDQQVSDRMVRLEAMLKKNRDTFLTYANNHLNKHTEDGNIKAKANFDLAEEIKKVLEG